jgi:hypothetical protein
MSKMNSKWWIIPYTLLYITSVMFVMGGFNMTWAINLTNGFEFFKCFFVIYLLSEGSCVVAKKLSEGEE